MGALRKPSVPWSKGHGTVRPTRQMVIVPRELHRCESCAELAHARLCADCEYQARPHIADDPYDDLGGEAGVVV